MAGMAGWRVVAAIAIAAACAAAQPLAAQPFGGVPDPVSNPASELMLDLPGTGTNPTAINFDALPVLSGTHTVVSQGDPTWQFRLHNYVTWYDNKYWMMWSHGPSIEDKPTQHVRFVTSPDGVNWSPEENVVGPSDSPGFRHIARGFWQREGQLYALASHDEAGGYFGDNLELRAYRWQASEERWDYSGVIADDTINNFEPKQLPTGQWMMSRRGDDYGTNPDDRSWLVGGTTSISDWTNSPIPVAANNARLEEPNFYLLPDGNLVSLYRDNSGSKRLYRSFSTDQGGSWTQPVPTNFPDATAKFYDLKTSHGYYVLVSNANPGGRKPLTLSVSRDGLVYTQMAVLDIPGTGSLQYPHAIEQDGNLLVAFSRNKTSIETIRVPLSAVDAILDYVPQPPASAGLVNGDFENLGGTFPSGWSIAQGAPAQHAGLGGSTTATLLHKQAQGGDRVTQTVATTPGPKWEMEFLFAMEDPGGAASRGFNVVLTNQTGGGNLNLRVNGDGSVQTVTSAPATTWSDVPNLSNAVQFSVDANADGDFSDAADLLNVHRLIVAGDYSTGSPEYTVSLSPANQAALTLSGTANLWFGAKPTAGSSITSVSISAQNSSGSYVVDQVMLRSLTTLAGDYNDDGVVDMADYVVWRNTLGSTTDLRADGDGGGQVNVHDYNVWRQNFGAPHGGTGSTTVVPEPGTLAIVMAGACCSIFTKQVPQRQKKKQWLDRSIVGLQKGEWDDTSR